MWMSKVLFTDKIISKRYHNWSFMQCQVEYLRQYGVIFRITIQVATINKTSDKNFLHSHPPSGRWEDCVCISANDAL